MSAGTPIVTRVSIASGHAGHIETILSVCQTIADDLGNPDTPNPPNAELLMTHVAELMRTAGDIAADLRIDLKALAMELAGVEAAK